MLAIVNGASAGGRTAKKWPELAQALRDAGAEFDVAFTEGPGHASELVVEALGAGRETIAACGGDGTLSEVVNGLIDETGAARVPGALLGIMPSGTGGDFRKTVGIPVDPRAAAELLVSGRRRKIDAGLIGYQDGTAPRRFINIASCGVGYEVDRRINNLKFKPGKLAYALVSGFSTLSYKPVTATVRVDGSELRGTFMSIALANGRYFGGGMLVAPEADPGDGQLDVVLASVTRFRTIAGARLLYKGKHFEAPGSLLLRGRKIEILPEGEARMGFDVDGEALGFCPATITALAGVLEVCC